jgi:hypothetical protein
MARCVAGRLGGRGGGGYDTSVLRLYSSHASLSSGVPLSPSPTTKTQHLRGSLPQEVVIHSELQRELTSRIYSYIHKGFKRGGEEEQMRCCPVSVPSRLLTGCPSPPTALQRAPPPPLLQPRVSSSRAAAASVRGLARVGRGGGAIFGLQRRFGTNHGGC